MMAGPRAAARLGACRRVPPVLPLVLLLLLNPWQQKVGSVSLDRYLQDPLPVAEFNVSTRSSLATVRGRFWDLQLHGLSATRLERATANLTGQTVEVATRTDLVSLQGQYVLSGDFAFVAIRGNGTFWMNATDAVASAGAELERGPNGGPWVRAVRAKLDVGDIQLHMDNLMGGGRWSTFSNSLLNQISGTVFKQAEQSLRGEIEETLRRRVNEELSRVPVDLTAARSERLVDALLESTAEQLRPVDPYALPDQARAFDQDLLLLRVQGEMRLQDGLLHGLSTLRRTGDVLAFYQNGTLLLEADVGFANLTSSWRWWAQLLGGGPSGDASLAVQGLSLHLRLALPIQQGAEAEGAVLGPARLEALELRSVGQVWLDLGGLGAFDFLLEALVNLVTNVFKWSIAEAALGAVAEALKKEIAALPPFELH
ncbi:hypothetical protein V5799_027098 [Amblyomma americanum]|uniref:Hemolymph juvenile hormone binding protein n=1 Tax=Amblyomma americanum TaxID=6943 RepID=A0AAQ4DGP4_AMBAM